MVTQPDKHLSPLRAKYATRAPTGTTPDTGAGQSANQVDEPESPSDQPDQAQAGDENKTSPEEAQYGKGSPVKHCGVCMRFTKDGDGNDGGCTKVQGVISGYGLCQRFYAEAKNPFGPMLGPHERVMINEMSQSPPDQSPHAAMHAAMMPPPGAPPPVGPASLAGGPQGPGPLAGPALGARPNPMSALPVRPPMRIGNRRY